MSTSCVFVHEPVSYDMIRCLKDIRFSAALLLISTLVLSFLHSELGMWDFDSCEHDQHDFCDLVNNAPTVQKVMKQDAVKDMAPAVICTDDLVSGRREHPFRVLPRSMPRVPHDVLYLDNCVLLI